MAPDEYGKALDKAVSDLENRVQQRELLSAEIAGLRETVRVLSNIAQTSPDKRQHVAQLLAMADYATPSLTDAVRTLLTKVYPKEMTAIEVRNALDDSSNSDSFGNSLSACHAALKRMLSDGEVEPGPTKKGKASYRRVIKLEAPVSQSALAILSGLADVIPRMVGVRLPEHVSDHTPVLNSPPKHPVEHLKRRPTPGELKGKMLENLGRKPK